MAVAAATTTAAAAVTMHMNSDVRTRVTHEHAHTPLSCIHTRTRTRTRTCTDTHTDTPTGRLTSRYQSHTRAHAHRYIHSSTLSHPPPPIPFVQLPTRVAHACASTQGLSRLCGKLFTPSGPSGSQRHESLPPAAARLADQVPDAEQCVLLAPTPLFGTQQRTVLSR